jgi:hypothetical protein
MRRVLAIELRRSAAPETALILMVIGVVTLFFADGVEFSSGWIQLAMSQRLYLALLWPLALAAGAWQSRREHRSKVEELFASTSRSRALRTAPTLAALAVAVTCGYLVEGIVGAGWIAGTARYLPVSAFVVTAVGVLALITAVWLGLAAGRLLPWPAAAPALGVAGLALLLLLPAATRPRGWLALVFSPIYEMNLPGPWTTVPGRASLSQTIWLTALAVTAVLLVVSGDWRLRLAALAPLVLGAAVAITIMPRDSRYVTDAIDPVAQQLVCAEGAPPVCLSRAHSGLFPEVTSGARQGLAVLAKLPGAPTQVHEDTTSYPHPSPAWRDDVVLLTVATGPNGHLAKGTDVRADVVAGAFASPPSCTEKFAGPAQRLAAASWLLGSKPTGTAEHGFEPAAGAEETIPDPVAEAVTMWEALRKLAPADAQARVVALRTAALSCTVDDTILAPGAP